jgi:hypothetical protein
MESHYPDVLQSFREGGWVMFLIFALGLPGVGGGLRFVWKGEHQLVAFLRYNTGAVLLASWFGFVVGGMHVLWYLTERATEGERVTTALVGLREASNNLSAGFLFALLTWMLLAIGHRRFPVPNPSALL